MWLRCWGVPNEWRAAEWVYRKLVEDLGEDTVSTASREKMHFNFEWVDELELENIINSESGCLDPERVIEGLLAETEQSELSRP